MEEVISYISTNIKKPIICLDLETSGTSIVQDEMVQFAGIKIFPNGSYKELVFKCKCKTDIHPKASEIHGIKKEDIQNLPEFKFFSKKLVSFIKGSDIVGFNHTRFDIPIIKRQLEECGFKDPFTDCVLYDVFSVFKAHFSRKLADAVSLYCGENIENAHDALADVKSTLKVLAKQIERENLPLVEIVNKTTKNSDDPLEKWIVYKDKIPYLNFSKHKGKSLEEVDKGMLRWIIKSDFPKELKDIIKKYI